MPLNADSTKKSLDCLSNTPRFTAMSQKDHTKRLSVLKKINSFCARESVALNRQSEKCLDILYSGLAQMSAQDEDTIAEQIFQAIEEQLNIESGRNQVATRSAGAFNGALIHRRGIFEQLEDHDMTALMPKTSKTIDVLAPVDQQQPIAPIIEGLRQAISNEQIKHIFIAIGPNHWRGVYITKPTPPDQTYHVELFDPFGTPASQRDKGLQTFVMGLLRNVRININKNELRHTGPRIPQKDGYACGDFVCAYSHLKMQLIDNTARVNQTLINALSQGNGNSRDNHPLRDAIRAESQKLSAATAAPAPTQAAAEVKETRATTATAITTYDQIQSSLTAREKECITEQVKNINGQRADSYKLALAQLLSHRKSDDSDFKRTLSQAKAAIRENIHITTETKEAPKNPNGAYRLNDAQFAALLQEAEAIEAGIDPISCSSSNLT